MMDHMEPLKDGSGDAGEQSNIRTQYAEERTSLARERNMMANERTYSAWIRTGLSLFAVAIALPKLLDIARWGIMIRIIGAVFIVIACILFLLASYRYDQASKRLKAEGMPPVLPTWVFRIIAVVLLICLLLSIILLF